MLITLGSCTVFIIHPRKTFATLNPEYTLEILRLSVLKIILYYVESFFFGQSIKLLTGHIQS